MPADRRHPLRFTLWTLVAIWATATIAAAATYLVVRLSESGEASYHGRDYIQQGQCTHAPSRVALVDISGFRPVSAGDVALVPQRESVRTPALIYVRSTGNHCVTRWTLDDAR